jgi:putative FmdB family regulatory protein
MPIYEYVCEKCNSHIEVMQKISDPPLKRCEKCRGKLEKIFSRTSFQLKGSGWYTSDYSSKSAPEKKDKAEKKGGAEKKSDSAPSSDATSGAKAGGASD